MTSAATAATIRTSRLPRTIAAIFATRRHGLAATPVVVMNLKPGPLALGSTLQCGDDQLPTPPAPPLLPGPLSRLSLPGSSGKVGGLTLPGDSDPAPVTERSSSWSLPIVGLSSDSWHASRSSSDGSVVQSKPGGYLGCGAS